MQWRVRLHKMAVYLPSDLNWTGSALLYSIFLKSRQVREDQIILLCVFPTSI